MSGAEFGDPVHQPIGGEGDAGGDGEIGLGADAPKLDRRAGDMLQPHGHRLVEALAGRGQLQMAGAALEHRRAEMLLQQLHLPAHGRLGHPQLLGRPGEVQMPGRGLEDHETIGGRQAAAQRYHEKI